MSGTLFVVATPIGNLGDLTDRAKETLRAVDVVAAEDTRRSLKLLTHLGIRKRLLRCDERMEERVSEEIARSLAAGSAVALLTDAGTPSLSDPGSRLVRRVAEAGFNVVAIPGPSAVTAALSVAGFPAVPFRFVGFLPKKGKERKQILDGIEAGAETTVLFESPHRVAGTLRELAARIPDRPAVAAKELTKLHERVFRGTLKDIATALEKEREIGEFTVVVAPEPRKKRVKINRYRAAREEE